MAVKEKSLTLIEAIREGIWEEMTADDSVFVIGEDVGAYGGAFKLTEGFIDHFGAERMIDTPISEAAIVGAVRAAGVKISLPPPQTPVSKLFEDESEEETKYLGLK